MIRTIYTSNGHAPLGPDALSEILNVSRRNNARDGISGMLLYHRNRFFQTLEGDEAAVNACLARIEADPRHVSVRTLQTLRVETRVFSRWRMGFADVAALQPDARESVFALAQMVDLSARGVVPDASLNTILRNFLVSVGASHRAGVE
ncbi:MAG: BLUF domain-containing protein [Pseudomonadota bacterium]